ncbi:MAG: ABC transporter substrate-binding protein [Oscillospiraceae bacterium]|nr:ABC transporter substrate-binding protein [Oscillospiraceae bacterium]
MKKFRKLLSIALSMALLLLLLAACGETGTQNSTSPSSSPDETEVSDSPLDLDEDDDLDTDAENGDDEDFNFEEEDEDIDTDDDDEDEDITDETILTVTEGLLIMGTNAGFPPYEYWEDGTIVGIDAEIAAAIADKLGLTLRIDDMDFTSIIAAVTTGRIDMGMAGMTVTEARLESVNFTTSYATGVQVVIIKESSPITSIDDLFEEDASYDIGVQVSTTGDLYTTWDLEEEGLATVHRFVRAADAVMALVSDRVDCVVIDNEPAKSFVAATPGLIILDTEYAVEDYAIAIAKENDALLNAIDTALNELIADGTVQTIVDKYISSD